MQLVNAIPSTWKNNLEHPDTYSQNLILLDHHLVQSNSFDIEKFESRELYCIINSSCNNKPTSKIYFEKKFEGHLYITTKSYHKHILKIVSI